MHPILFLSSGSYQAQERLDQIRKDIQSGHAKNLWQSIKAQADDELNGDLITTATALPHRGADQIEMKKPRCDPHQSARETYHASCARLPPHP